MRKMSEKRYISRLLLRLARKGRLRKGISDTTYVDNKGIEYPWKWMAATSSFINFVVAGIRNGFPIVVNHLHYVAWAFYPFFFIRRDVADNHAIHVLNHERIHIRQQFDIHCTISLPIIVAMACFGNFNILNYICCIFTPTMLYAVEMLRSFITMAIMHKTFPPFKWVRANTCFEREAQMHELNTDYLMERRMLSVIKYL